MLQAFDRPIIQINLCDFNIWIVHALDIHGKPMILRGNEDFPVGQVLDWLIGPAVAEL